MLDTAWGGGLAYLHGNVILHRDVKPDNVLVFALDDVLAANRKQTVFGSSRKVNMLMTNMTFTKGIGTPTEMEMEMLNNKNKKLADVFLFGVTLFECFKCGEAYEKARFRNLWDIMAFVAKGEHLVKPSTMQLEVNKIIS